MDLRRSIKKRYQKIIASYALRRYKYVHLMFNDKFNKPFVDFLNKHFNKKEHLVLCKRSFSEFSFPEGSNVIEVMDYSGLDFSCNNIEKIICHSLFDEELINLLYTKCSLLDKSYWMIWGGDLYGAVRDEKNDFVRKHFRGYLGDLDKEYALRTYDMQGRFYKAFYLFPISARDLDNVSKKESDCVTIQVNHSSDMSTLEMLDILGRFKDNNIVIRTVISYGDIQYNDQIVARGKEIFGDKFEYLDTFLNPVQYAQYLAQNDIFILNQADQQGFGNTLASLYCGTKVFIRSQSSVYDYLNNNGCYIYNSEDIANLDFCQFVLNPHSNINKKEVREKYYNENYIAHLYRELF
ncbi:hypothetical protein NHP164001_00460 [Helicobacter trogontum]|uniref:4-alpha-L-fucosyltransferase n=1 Tax=Helicobacter trogontum TaxID=50960 RepID=A0ABQ0D124_9HELI